MHKHTHNNSLFLSLFLSLRLCLCLSLSILHTYARVQTHTHAYTRAREHTHTHTHTHTYRQTGTHAAGLIHLSLSLFFTLPPPPRSLSLPANVTEKGNSSLTVLHGPRTKPPTISQQEELHHCASRRHGRTEHKPLQKRVWNRRREPRFQTLGPDWKARRSCRKDSDPIPELSKKSENSRSLRRRLKRVSAMAVNVSYLPVPGKNL